MRSLSAVIIITLVFLFSGCKKDDLVSSSDQFTNKLTFGTGLDLSHSAFTLTGEGNIFTRSSAYTTIYYRLESAEDYGGAGVSIKIEKLSGSVYTLIGTYPYTNPQNYGHIIISAFDLSELGNYRATGFLTANSNVIATATFTIK